MPLTPEIKKVICNFLNFNNISNEECTYLETGLSMGESIRNILSLNFKKVISIEIDKGLVDKASDLFKNEILNSKVLFIHGDSQKKIKEIFNQDINIIFLDAHISGIEHDVNTIAPLENELNFLIDKINDKQLIIIDDFIKIRNNFLFTDSYDWKSKFSYEKFKKIISKKELNSFEIFFSDRANSYLLITKNKNFKIEKKLLLKNLFFRFLSIKFYLKNYKFLVYRIIKKLIIFLTSENFFNNLKKKLFLSNKS